MKFLLCFVYVLTVLSVVRAWDREGTPEKDINATIFWGDNINFENELIKSMTQTPGFFQNKTNAKFLEYLTTAVSLCSSSAAPFATILKGVLAEISSEGDFKRSLSKTIADGTMRLIISEKVASMKSAVQSINEHFESLKSSSPGHIPSKVNDIKFKLSEMVGELSPGESNFRKYPELVAETIIAIAALYISFHPIFHQTDHYFADRTLLPCRIASTLEEYRDLFVFVRLSGVYAVHDTNGNQVYPGKRCSAQDPSFNQVLMEPFRRDGYNEGWTRCKLHNGCRDIFRICVRDLIENTDYETLWEDSSPWKKVPTDCYKDYLRVLRHRIEKVFQPHIDVTKSICERPEFRRSKFQYPTGLGWLQLRLKFFLTTYREYDAIGQPDVYVIIKIDGQQKYRSATIQYPQIFDFNDVYQSAKIHKNATITLEAWDEDNEWHFEGQDDFMFSWTVTIEELLKNGCHKSGTETLCVATFWKDELGPNAVIQNEVTPAKNDYMPEGCYTSQF